MDRVHRIYVKQRKEKPMSIFCMIPFTGSYIICKMNGLKWKRKKKSVVAWGKDEEGAGDWLQKGIKELLTEAEILSTLSETC